MSNQLLPCPFCGAEPAPYTWKAVGCMTPNCAMEGLHIYHEAWNRRATQPAAGEPVAFANELISGALQGGDFSGADIQELAVKHGLLREERRDEACRDEGCACAEYGFPTECYRKNAALASPAAAPVAAGEPVAWMTRPRIGSYEGREFICEPDASLNLDQWEKPFPVYAAPPAAAHGDEAVRKDAERYRWLNQECQKGGQVVFLDVEDVGFATDAGAALDNAIDAAMRAQAGEGGEA